MNTSPPRMLPSNDNIPSFGLGKVEPSFLVSMNGSGSRLGEERKTQKKRHPSKTTDESGRRKTSRGLRKLRGLSKSGSLRGLTKSGSRRRIGIDSSDAANLTVSERLSQSISSFDSKQNNEMNIRVTKRELTGHRLPPFVGSMTDVLYRYTHSSRELIKSEKACLIQAVFRGFLGRTKAKEQALLNRLKAIEKSKKIALQKIEERKRKEMSKCQAKHIIRARILKERWQNKSDVIAQLIPKVRAVRETNEKLKRELVLLKRENKQLAIANSAILRSAAKEELRINRIERCGLQLHGVTTNYREALLGGRKCLRDLDQTPINVINADDELIDEHPGDRLSEIKRVLHKAKVEDQLL